MIFNLFFLILICIVIVYFTYSDNSKKVSKDSKVKSIVKAGIENKNDSKDRSVALVFVDDSGNLDTIPTNLLNSYDSSTKSLSINTLKADTVSTGKITTDGNILNISGSDDSDTLVKGDISIIVNDKKYNIADIISIFEDRIRFLESKK